MNQIYERTQLLIGEQAIEKLKSSHVAVFGIGGVGGHAAEALVRSGVGAIDLFDKDTVSESNLNRQLIAVRSNIGKLKVDAMRERIADINPDVKVACYPVFYLPANADDYDLSQYDYIIDAIDTVTAKLELIERADRLGVPVISSMGAGNKLHPELFEIADIYETSICPLARIMRKELRARNIESLKVVYSKEEPVKKYMDRSSETRPLPGSIAFVPSAAGIILAGAVIRDLISA